MYKGGFGLVYFNIFYVVSCFWYFIKLFFLQFQFEGDQVCVFSIVWGLYRLGGFFDVKLGVYDFFRVCGDGRVGQNSGKDQGLRQGMGVIGFGGMEGKMFQGSFWQLLDVGKGFVYLYVIFVFFMGKVGSCLFQGFWLGEGNKVWVWVGGKGELDLGYIFFLRFFKFVSGFGFGI